MKKLFISSIVALIVFSVNAQEFTNLYTAYRQHNCIVADDSLIYVGCSRGINIYYMDGRFKTTVGADGEVYSAVRDHDGNIWFGVFAYTQGTKGGGLIKYDGSSWEFIPVSDNFVYTGITSITCDRNNNIWAAINPGDGQNLSKVSKYNGTNWVDYTTFSDTIEINIAEEIVCDTSNTIFVGITSNSIESYYNIISISESDTVLYNNLNSGTTVACKHSSLVDKQNRVWFGGCFGRINSFENGAWTVHDNNSVFNNGSFSVIYQDFQDRMILVLESKLFTEGEIEWEVNTFLNEHSLSSVSDINSDSEEKIWLVGNFDYGDAREGCLITPVADTFQFLHPQSHIGFPREIAFSGKNIWFGKNAYLSSFNGEIWNNLFTTENLCSEITTTVCTDINSNLWYGTSTALYRQTQGQSAEQILQLCGENITGVQCIAKYNNCIWVKANGMNLYKFNGTEWSKIDMTDAASSTFLKIVPRNENEFWATSYAGAIRFDGTNWSNYTINEGLSSDNVNDFAFENDSIWIATKKGIALLYNSSINTIFNDSSLVSGYSNFNSIFIDKHGNKWAGSEKAVLKFNNSSFEYLYPTGIKEKIYSITEDPERNLWFCGSNAVSKYTFDNSNIENLVAEHNSLKIFPNPAKQEIYYDLSSSTQSDILEIYSTSGAVIYQQKIQTGTNKINIESLPAGMYLVRIRGENLYGKFVKE